MSMLAVLALGALCALFAGPVSATEIAFPMASLPVYPPYVSLPASATNQSRISVLASGRLAAVYAEGEELWVQLYSAAGVKEGPPKFLVRGGCPLYGSCTDENQHLFRFGSWGAEVAGLHNGGFVVVANLRYEYPLWSRYHFYRSRQRLVNLMCDSAGNLTHTEWWMSMFRYTFHHAKIVPLSGDAAFAVTMFRTGSAKESVYSAWFDSHGKPGNGVQVFSGRLVSRFSDISGAWNGTSFTTTTVVDTHFRTACCYGSGRTYICFSCYGRRTEARLSLHDATHQNRYRSYITFPHRRSIFTASIQRQDGVVAALEFWNGGSWYEGLAGCGECSANRVDVHTFDKIRTRYGNRLVEVAATELSLNHTNGTSCFKVLGLIPILGNPREVGLVYKEFVPQRFLGCASSGVFLQRLAISALGGASLVGPKVYLLPAPQFTDVVAVDTPHGVGVAYGETGGAKVLRAFPFEDTFPRQEFHSVSQCLLPLYATDPFDFASFNVLVFGNLSSQGGSVEGRVASFENFSGENFRVGSNSIYSFASAGRSAFGLVVGGDVSWTNSMLLPSNVDAFVGKELSGTFPLSRVAGSCSINSTDANATNERCLDRVFSAVRSKMVEFQEDVMGVTDNATFDVRKNGGIVVTCLDPDAAAYAVTIPGDVVSASRWWTVSGCNFSAFWAINILGSDIKFGLGSLGTIPERTIFNIIPVYGVIKEVGFFDYNAVSEEYFHLNDTLLFNETTTQESNETGGFVPRGSMLVTKRVTGHILASDHHVEQRGGLIIGLVVAGSLAGSPLSIKQPHCGTVKAHNVELRTAKKKGTVPPQAGDESTNSHPCGAANIMFVESHGQFQPGDELVVDKNQTTEERLVVDQLLFAESDDGVIEPVFRFRQAPRYSHDPDSILELEIGNDAFAQRVPGPPFGKIFCASGSETAEVSSDSRADLSVGATLGIVMLALLVCGMVVVTALVRSRATAQTSSGGDDESSAGSS
jgi:choice-of-anchor A domain-containing protein